MPTPPRAASPQSYTDGGEFTGYPHVPTGTRQEKVGENILRTDPKPTTTLGTD